MRAITLEEIDKYISENEQDESAYLKPASEYVDQVISHFYDVKEVETNRLPWTKAISKFNLRRAEVTCWLGYNGHGKSLILGQIANHLMSLGEKVCIASMEMRPHVTMARMCKQAFAVRSPTVELIRGYHNWTDSRLWIYDQHGSTPLKRVINLCRYAHSLGIQHIVIDSLMKVVSREDDYNGQKEFIDSLCILARDTGMHIHVVHHSRKGQDEKKRPGKMDAKGSGAITDLVDNCVSVWRKKEEDREVGEFDCVLTIDKQRHGEWEGGIGLFFDADSQSFYEDKYRKVVSLPIEGCSVNRESF
jgi:twinkle protein